MTCTRVVKSDLKEWLAMGCKLWPREGDLQPTFEKILKSTREIAFMYRTTAGEPVGFTNVSIRKEYVNGSNTSPVGFLEGIYVEKKFRKHGVVKILERMAEVWAAKRGCTEMSSDALIANKTSHAFHKAIGFKEAERVVVFIKKITVKGE